MNPEPLMNAELPSGDRKTLPVDRITSGPQADSLSHKKSVLPRFVNLLLALLSAALLILTFPRFQLTWLAPVALAPLLIAVSRETRPWRRFVLGWAAGAVFWFGVCYWIEY